MGESRRKRLAGYVPEPNIKKNKTIKREFIVGHGGMGTMAILSALMVNYPKLPKD